MEHSELAAAEEVKTEEELPVEVETSDLTAAEVKAGELIAEVTPPTYRLYDVKFEKASASEGEWECYDERHIYMVAATMDEAISRARKLKPKMADRAVLQAHAMIENLYL